MALGKLVLLDVCRAIEHAYQYDIFMKSFQRLPQYLRGRLNFCSRGAEGPN